MWMCVWPAYNMFIYAKINDKHGDGMGAGHNKGVQLAAYICIYATCNP